MSEPTTVEHTKTINVPAWLLAEFLRLAEHWRDHLASQSCCDYTLPLTVDTLLWAQEQGDVSVNRKNGTLCVADYELLDAFLEYLR
jgi:hypothetical protein